jgi:hypothetical protein
VSPVKIDLLFWLPRWFRCPYLLPVTTGSWVVPTVDARCRRWRGHRGAHSVDVGRPQ